jgi:hypothetical protein
MLHPNLLPYVASIIDDHPQGLSEYTLINILCKHPYNLFDKEQIKTPLGLFQLHFILFHGLYLLQRIGFENKKYHLEISTLNIKKHPYSIAKSGITSYDALTEYYLDLSQLVKTNEQDVDQLLQSFWKNYLAGDQKKEALTALEISGECNATIIKQQYRKLVNIHHPDKGGEKNMFIKIQQAKETLLLLY